MKNLALLYAGCIAIVAAIALTPAVATAQTMHKSTGSATMTTTPAPAATKSTRARPANEYTTESEAKRHCASGTVVWANLSSKVYHFSGNRNYGKTKRGAYMCRKDADSGGFHAAKGEKAPK